jgi:hypothetical protein
MVMCEMLDGYLPDMAAVLAKNHRVWRQRCRCWFEQSSKSSCRITGRREPRSLDQDSAQRTERQLDLMYKERKEVDTKRRVIICTKTLSHQRPGEAWLNTRSRQVREPGGLKR